MPAVKGANELAADFGTGALGVGKESGEFRMGSAIKTLGNVVHDRSHGSIELIGKSEVPAKGTGLENLPEPLIQDSSDLPSFNFLK
jgi:hypothetical protein